MAESIPGILKRLQIRAQASIPKNWFLVRISSVVELILGRGERGPENETKSIPALKIYILWNMANSIPYLSPTHFQESIFPPITRPKIPAQEGSLSSCSLYPVLKSRTIYGD